MTMRKMTLATVLVFATSANVFADDGSGANTTCPVSIATAIDAQVGPGASAQTDCLAKRDHIKVVAALNNDDLASNGAGQQVVNVDNMVADYAKYGIVIGTGEDKGALVAVAYGDGARWLLTKDAYVAKVDSAATDNPSRARVEQLIAKGVKFYMCQNTMKSKKYAPGDLIANVRMVPAGVTAVIDFENRGYKYISP